MSLDPQHTYVHLAADGRADTVAGGDAFWSLPAQEMERFGRGWQVSEFSFDADWTSWEMHPEADEFVYLLSGAADVLLELPDETRRVRLRGRGAVLVPRGVWHRVEAIEPSCLMHVTPGPNGGYRPREMLDR